MVSPGRHSCFMMERQDWCCWLGVTVKTWAGMPIFHRGKVGGERKSRRFFEIRIVFVGVEENNEDRGADGVSEDTTTLHSCTMSRNRANKATSVAQLRLCVGRTWRVCVLLFEVVQIHPCFLRPHVVGVVGCLRLESQVLRQKLFPKKGKHLQT